MIDYSGRIITGLQMRTSAENSSGVMGAEGNPSLALRKSIDKGMRLNKAGKHVNYLEIYEPDVLANETQPVLRYMERRYSDENNIGANEGGVARWVRFTPNCGHCSVWLAGLFKA